MSEPPALDLDFPAVSRMHSYWTGGLDHYQHDRDQAAMIGRICPAAMEMPRHSREFTARAVTWAAGQGVAQFIDLGCGFLAAREFWEAEHPGSPRRSAVPEDVHVTARAVNPDVRVAYVDNDREVTSSGAVLLAPPWTEGVAVISADLRDPAAVLADPGLLKVIDLGEPACVILGLVLHYMTAARARDLVAGYVRAAAPGSSVVISVPRFDDPAMFAAVRDAYTPARIRNFTPNQVNSFFAGLDLVRPGVAPAAGLRPGWGDAPQAREPAYLLGGIGIRR